MTAWTKSNWTDASQIVGMIDAEADVEPASGKTLPDWFATLLATEDYAAALNFLAHAMSRYDCVVWATRVILEAGMADRSDPRITATLRWIDNPEDDSVRRGAFELTEAITKTSPARMLAQAVFFAGGSIAPDNSQPVPAPPDVCAKLASAAVLTGAYTQPDPKAAMRRALDTGEAMVRGNA